MPNKKYVYRLLPLAEYDLEEIWLYGFQNFLIKQADKYHKAIVLAFEGLASGVKIGKIVDIRKNYLKYFTGSHIVFYKKLDNHLEIVRILHQQMDVKRHLN